MAGEVLRDGLIVGAQGTVIGLLGGAILARQLRSLLFEVSPLDPWAYISVIPALAVVVLVATGLPAWRAARLDPVRALRGER